MTTVNTKPELTTLTDDDFVLAWDAQTGTTRKVKASTIKTYATSAVISPTLVAGATVDYRFDQTSGQQLNDYSGNDLHGILGGTSSSESVDPSWVTWASCGLDFATNKYISLPTRNWFSGSFYIEAVIYLRSYANWSRILDVSPSAGSLTGNVYFGVSSGTSGKPTLGILEGSATTFISSPIAIPTYKWVHLSASFSNGTATIYMNGVPLVSGTLPTPISVNQTIAYVGRSQFSGDAYLDGIIGRLAIYNKLLSNAERALNFTAIRDYMLTKGVYFS